MTSQLAYTPLPEDIELAELSLTLERQRDRLSRREQERADLELALAQFATQVKSRVGDLKDEIRSYRARLEQIRQRLQRLKDDPEATPAEIERELDEEILEEPEFDPAGGYRGRSEGPPAGMLPSASPTPPQTMAEIIRIYRLLAKRHHPDLATSPVERERRTELMLRINIAYRDHNLAALKAILLEVHNDVPLTQRELARQRISWTQHELARIQRELQAVDQRIRSLLLSDTYTLWRAELEGNTALDELERRTRERLQRERARLEEATSQYARMAARRHVMLRRAASRAAPSAAPGSD